tara:strand:+ start:2780 stop:3922 length:1143 start_codon:yes stop_codon:yes gene_type:complete
MKRLSFLYIFFFILVSCSNEKTETVQIGNKKTEILEIKSFDDSEIPKNIILVVGDGAGLNQIMISRIAEGGLDYKLAIDQLPHQGLVLTHAYENIITDSAAAATAWATGFKTKNRYLSLTPENKILKTIPEMLSKKGYSSGLVATSSITHATPAAFYAHIDSRYKEVEIASQLLNSPIDVALGGGQEFFEIGKVTESYNLLTEKSSLNDDFSNSNKILGLFDKDGIVRSSEKPSQRDMTNFALTRLLNNTVQCEGFFLMTEGSQIDWAAHDNNVTMMIEEFKDFDLTIKDLVNFTSENEQTLLIITADHETGGLQILKQQDDSVIIQWGTGRHTAIPVGVYAYGPGAYLFNGVMDNTEIHYKILEAINFTNLEESTCDLK